MDFSCCVHVIVNSYDFFISTRLRIWKSLSNLCQCKDKTPPKRSDAQAFLHVQNVPYTTLCIVTLTRQPMSELHSTANEISQTNNRNNTYKKYKLSEFIIKAVSCSRIIKIYIYFCLDIELM